MSWRDNLQDASYRDVPFKVRSHSISGGRRIKETERWQKRTLTTDMGPILPRFNVEAYIIQNIDNEFDYFNNRDNLLDVLQNNTDDDKYNVGTLIHPFFGRRRVHVGEYSIQESFDEGGIATFNIEFLLEEDELFPGKITSPAAKIDAVAEKVNNYSIDNFLDTMNTAASFVEDLGRDAIEYMQKIQQAASSVNGVLKSSLTTASGVISAAMDTVVSVLDSPCELYETLQSAGESFKYLVGMAGTVVQGGIVGGCSGESRGTQITLDGSSIPEELGKSVILQMITAQSTDESSYKTISAEQEDNRILMFDVMKLQMLTFACRVFARIDFTSKQQLLIYLELLMDALDDYLLRLGEQTDLDVTDFYLGAELMRSNLAEQMYIKLNLLQNEITYSTGYGVQSTLELSYNLYEDTSRCAEIFNKNKLAIKHPGFIPQDSEIQVLEK